MEKTVNELFAARAEAEMKAWDSLSRYKFMMFGYWAACWVKFNRILSKEFPPAKNPFKSVVDHARFKIKDLQETRRLTEKIKQG